jgi:hypothetical protein
MITLSGLASSSLGGSSGLLSSIGAEVSVPLGSLINLGNTLGVPWYQFFINLLAPVEGGVLPTAINAFVGQLTTTITNLLGG